MAVDPRERYMAVQIQTASPEKLITMLYDGAIRFLRQARQQLEERKYNDVNTSMTRAQDIVYELMASLDMEQGEISQGLYALYDYIIGQLIEANIKKDANLMRKAELLITELRQTWAQAMSSVAAQQVMDKSAQVQAGR